MNRRDFFLTKKGTPWKALSSWAGIWVWWLEPLQSEMVKLGLTWGTEKHVSKGLALCILLRETLKQKNSITEAGSLNKRFCYRRILALDSTPLCTT